MGDDHRGWLYVAVALFVYCYFLTVKGFVMEKRFKGYYVNGYWAGKNRREFYPVDRYLIGGPLGIVVASMGVAILRGTVIAVSALLVAYISLILAKIWVLAW